jgi:hypothetical protein
VSIGLCKLANEKELGPRESYWWIKHMTDKRREGSIELGWPLPWCKCDTCEKKGGSRMGQREPQALEGLRKSQPIQQAAPKQRLLEGPALGRDAQFW